MAKDNDKSNKGKSASKKSKKEPTNWGKIIVPLLLVFIMLGSIFAYVASSNWGNRIDNGGSSGTSHAFDSLSDGLRLIPYDAGFVRYADLKNDSVLSNTFNNYVWLKGSVPSADIFSATPQRDMFAIYPSQFFSSSPSQFVSLTDFGTSSINKSYPDSTGSDNSHSMLSNLNIVPKEVNANYYFTPSTVPVISGQLDNIAPVAYVMMSGNSSLSSYNQYADLFTKLNLKQIYIKNMTFETAGTSCNLTGSDRYYAAVGPADPSNTSQDRLYTYKVIIHVTNSSVADKYQNDLALLQGAMQKMGFKTYNTQVYDDYIVIEAQGSLGLCLDDMYNRWGFIKYQASL